MPPTSLLRILYFLLTFLSYYCGKKHCKTFRNGWNWPDVAFSTVSLIFRETFGFFLWWTAFSADAKLVEGFFTSFQQHIWRQKLFPVVLLRKGWGLTRASYFVSDVLQHMSISLVLIYHRLSRSVGSTSGVNFGVALQASQTLARQ